MRLVGSLARYLLGLLLRNSVMSIAATVIRPPAIKSTMAGKCGQGWDIDHTLGLGPPILLNPRPISTNQFRTAVIKKTTMPDPKILNPQIRPREK